MHLFKIIFYSNFLCAIIRHSLFSRFAVAISTVYFLLFEIYRNEWPIFIQHERPAQILFLGLIGLSGITTIICGASDWIEDIELKKQDGLKKDLITLASKLVRAKLDRFKNAAEKLSSKTNIFGKITHPADQINILLSEVSKLLQERFKLAEDEICITIIGVDDTQEKTKAGFAFTTHRDWKHTKAREILNGKSTASKCLETGEPVFFFDKLKAANKGMYLLSERDKRMGNGKGSAYCHPSFTKTDKKTFKYLISIITYNKRIGHIGDKQEIEAIKVIFNEICRRIDLELTLKSIKDWQTA